MKIYRVLEVQSKVYAIEMDVDDLEDDLDNLREFMLSGDTVIFTSDLEDLEGYNIDVEDVEVIR